MESEIRHEILAVGVGGLITPLGAAAQCAEA